MGMYGAHIGIKKDNSDSSRGICQSDEKSRLSHVRELSSHRGPSISLDLVGPARKRVRDWAATGQLMHPCPNPDSRKLVVKRSHQDQDSEALRPPTSPGSRYLANLPSQGPGGGHYSSSGSMCVHTRVLALIRRRMSPAARVSVLSLYSVLHGICSHATASFEVNRIATKKASNAKMDFKKNGIIEKESSLLTYRFVICSGG